MGQLIQVISEDVWKEIVISRRGSPKEQRGRFARQAAQCRKGYKMFLTPNDNLTVINYRLQNATDKMPAHLGLPDPLVNLVQTAMLAPMERKDSPASPAMLLQLQPAPMVDAASAPTDPKAQLDQLDLLDPP